MIDITVDTTEELAAVTRALAATVDFAFKARLRNPPEEGLLGTHRGNPGQRVFEVSVRSADSATPGST